MPEKLDRPGFVKGPPKEGAVIRVRMPRKIWDEAFAPRADVPTPVDRITCAYPVNLPIELTEAGEPLRYADLPGREWHAPPNWRQELDERARKIDTCDWWSPSQ